MSERALEDYIPQKRRTGKVAVDVRQDLAPVVGRIAQVLPADKVWEFFSSSPGETGGKIVFPYCRVDSAVIACRDYAYMIGKYNPEPSKFTEWYGDASREAFRAVAWVEVGFEGLENLARSRASVNWTSGVGHFVDDEERAEGIMTEGARFYRQFLTDFIDMRTERGVRDDYFTQYGLENALYGVKTAKARADLSAQGLSAKFIEDSIAVLIEVTTYDGLRAAFQQRDMMCGEEQFLMPVLQRAYLTDPKLRERLVRQISEQGGVNPELADEYMADMGNDPSLVFVLRHGDGMDREVVRRFCATAPLIVFAETRKYLGLR